MLLNLEKAGEYYDFKENGTISSKQLCSKSDV